jgi:hypothetical protein
MSSIAAWAGDRDSAGLRRWLQIGLGVVWVLDAALQYQPYMFSRGFVTNIVDPASSGNPARRPDPGGPTARGLVSALPAGPLTCSGVAAPGDNQPPVRCLSSLAPWSGEDEPGP